MAGSLNLRFTTGAVQAASANQWAPTLDAHEPNPPLSIEDGVVKRAPLITSLWPLSVSVALLACTPPNLLLSTLAPPPAPFSQASWPVPQARAASVELRTWIGQNLALTTLAPSAAAPFAQEDWPNPQARRATQDGQPPNLLGTTLVPQQAAPFVPVAWENPQLAPLRNATQHYRPSVDPTPQAQTAPFSQTEWPNPTRARGFVDRASQGGVLYDPVMPPSAGDWPNPLRAQRPIDLLTWIESPAVPAPAATPVASVVWPNPVKARPRFAGAFLGGVLVDLTPVVPVDWPLPKFRQPNVAQLTWLDSVKLAAQIAPVMPPASGDWPNPQRKPLDVVRLTWQQSPAVPPPAPPPSYNLPVPRGYAFPLANRGHIQAAAVWLIGQDRFFGPPGMAPVYDYPNPRGARRSIVLRVHSYAFPVDVLSSSVPTPLYGWGARSKIGGTPATDPWSRIGSERADDPATSIGSASATDANTKIGSDKA